VTKTAVLRINGFSGSVGLVADEFTVSHYFRQAVIQTGFSDILATRRTGLQPVARIERSEMRERRGQ
jgi:hypothetical protein